METFQLQLLLKIIGLGSASGLLFNNNTLLAIGDNSSFLFEYHMNSKELIKHPLVENASDAILKKDKLDFEAVTQFDNKIYVFGSGSTDKRMQMITVDATTKKVLDSIDLSNLYAAMQSFAEIKPEDFNIEGVTYNGENWFLFNRGNGTNGQNVVFTIGGANLTDDFSVVFNKIKLPKIKGVRATFTDAVLVDNKIYFLATAEDTVNTYDDGEVLGSLIGRMDATTMKVDFTKKITDSHKLEGIALAKKSEKEMEFMLCEDNDTELLESNIFKLTLTLK